MIRALSLVLSSAVLLFGCGSKDNISLSATVSKVQLSVIEQALGTQLSGGFDLNLEVGAEADGDGTVELESFSIVRAADQGTLVGALQAVPQGVSFPLKVGKGQSKAVPFLLDDSALLPSADKANLCAGEVQLVGAVKHNLNGGETKPLRGKALLPSGC
ncbi:MAG: hypothetical protein IPI67_04110 [Myxococcales bacterium]|nr:hypothetical protein [Myxococcales bacterium]